MWVLAIGVIGFALWQLLEAAVDNPAKGLAISIIGILLALAALQFNPGQAGA